MVEFVRHVDDIVVVHNRVMGMNFIPGGYKMSAVLWEAHTKAKSPLAASGVGEIETESPSPAYDDEFCDTQHDDDLPPSPAEQDLLSSSKDEDRRPSSANMTSL